MCEMNLALGVRISHKIHEIWAKDWGTGRSLDRSMVAIYLSPVGVVAKCNMSFVLGKGLNYYCSFSKASP